MAHNILRNHVGNHVGTWFAMNAKLNSYMLLLNVIGLHVIKYKMLSDFGGAKYQLRDMS